LTGFFKPIIDGQQFARAADGGGEYANQDKKTKGFEKMKKK
jgi:hypothetical protein